MSSAFSCDFCHKLYTGEETSSKKKIVFNKKSLEVIITVQDQQTNQQFDICENCMGGIIKAILREMVEDDLKKET